MNERIKELAEQATEKFITYFDGRGNVTETYFDKEKFAELIVRECAESMPQENLKQMVLKHFGVDE